MSPPRHPWGCVCGLCTRRAADIANESARIREHNRKALRPMPGPARLGSTDPYIRPEERGPAFDKHYSHDWMGRPKDV